MTSGSASASAGGFDAATMRLLDHFDVPVPGDDFLDRLAIIPASPAPGIILNAAPPRFRRRGRGPWVRRTVTGLVALGLASATAAATGVFSVLPFDIPVITQLLDPTPAPTRVASAPSKSARKVAPSSPPTPLATASIPAVEQAPSVSRGKRLEKFQSLPMPIRAVITERVVTRIQRRLERRGITVPRDAVRAEIIARTGQTDLPPAAQMGTPRERRAAARDALIAAPAGSLPPRLEMLRQRAIGAGPASSGNPMMTSPPAAGMTNGPAASRPGNPAIEAPTPIAPVAVPIRPEGNEQRSAGLPATQITQPVIGPMSDPKVMAAPVVDGQGGRVRPQQPENIRELRQRRAQRQMLRRLRNR